MTNLSHSLKNLKSSKTALGIIYMLAGMAILSAMDASVKWLTEHSIHTVQLLVTRSVIIVPCMLAYYSLKGRQVELIPTRKIAQGLRGTLGSIAPLSFFIGLAYMPLTTAVVIFFSAIFMTTILSIVFLGEKVGKHRWFAIIIGYAGVLIAMNPQGGGSHLGYGLVLLGSFSYACLFVSGRHLSKTESVPSLVISYNLGTGFAMLFLLPWFWSIPSLGEWAMVLLMTGLAMTGHYCVTRAFSETEASLLAPLEFSTVLWAVLFDLAIWQQLPDRSTWIGAAIIFAAGLYLIHREKRVSRK